MEDNTLNELIKQRAAIEHQINAIKLEQNEIRKDKRYVNASKFILFIIVFIVFLSFLIASYIAMRSVSATSATENLRILANWSQIVLIAIIAKSGFENLSKGSIRKSIINHKIAIGENVLDGAEDFRNSV